MYCVLGSEDLVFGGETKEVAVLGEKEFSIVLLLLQVVGHALEFGPNFFDH